MSMNLGCKGFYMVPIQIGTYDSYMIYSNNDGGSAGVFYRLKQYYLRRQQEDLNNLSFKGKSGTTEYKDTKEFWNELLEPIDAKLADAKKHPERYDFYVC